VPSIEGHADIAAAANIEAAQARLTKVDAEINFNMISFGRPNLVSPMEKARPERSYGLAVGRHPIRIRGVAGLCSALANMRPVAASAAKSDMVARPAWLSC
jgi:hypothetical protein